MKGASVVEPRWVIGRALPTPSTGHARQHCSRPHMGSARRVLKGMAGHVWTVGPALISSLQSPVKPHSRVFRTVIEDPALGQVRLTGLFSELAGSETIVLVVHGLAGNAASPYCASAARAAIGAGFSCLRLSLRGADYSGEDILHGGITPDVWAALAAPAIARYKHVLLLGYSVGGHIALRAAIEGTDSRLRAAAAICPPLDLHQAAAAFDHPARRPYRLHIFQSLNRAYAATAARGRAHIPPEIVARARSCRERDYLTVVPRFGYASAEDYYERESVAHKLHDLKIPSLVVASHHDPLVPAPTLLSSLAGAPNALSVKWVEPGGHVYFPRRLDLGQSGPVGLEHQVIRWLAERSEIR